MVHPASIHDPQFEVIRILHCDDDFSVAYGRWEGGAVCLGMRWNGAEGRLGYPVGRHRQPKFLVLPESFNGPVLRMLAAAGMPGTDLVAVRTTLAEEPAPVQGPSRDGCATPDAAASSDPQDTDHLLRIAKWHLDQLERTSATTPELASLLADHADVVTVFAAASAEARLNSFIASPLLFMNEEGPRRFLAALVTKHLRLSVPQKLKFLRDRAPGLKGNDVLTKVKALCTRRNGILHISFEYQEVKSLPGQPYVEGLHSHLPENHFVQRPALSTHRRYRPPLDQAREDYETACAFLQLMSNVHPFEPWPPPGFAV